MYLLYFICIQTCSPTFRMYSRTDVILSNCLRQKPNETSCSVQSDDHSLVFGNLAQIQTCLAEWIMSENMPLSSKAGQTKTKVDTLENSEATITAKEQSRAALKLKPTCYRSVLMIFFFHENTKNFTALKLLRFNTASLSALLIWEH